MPLLSGVFEGEIFLVKIQFCSSHNFSKTMLVHVCLLNAHLLSLVDIRVSETQGRRRTRSPSPGPPLALKAPSLSPVLTEKQNITRRKTFPASRFFSSTPKSTSKQLYLAR